MTCIFVVFILSSILSVSLIFLEILDLQRGKYIVYNFYYKSVIYCVPNFLKLNLNKIFVVKYDI